MKTKVLFTLWLCLAIPSTSFSQNTNDPNDEVTLVVSADGATKEEATKVALRSAIEQAYGTFVSANTTILNDDLVKDEIVTISNGNIKNYEEVASAMLPNGKQSVTLKATVCISKLVSYAQSKGASTEFAGATFAMNMKMKELNKKNEMVALENLLVQIKELLPYAYDSVLEVEDPKLANKTDIVKDENMENRYNTELGSDFWNVYVEHASDYYEMNIKVHYIENSNTRNFYLLIYNTLSSLFVTEIEREEMQKLNIKELPELRMHFPYVDGDFKYLAGKGGSFRCYLRASKKELEEWVTKVRNAFYKEFTNFVITDNLGVKSFFDGYSLFCENTEGESKGTSYYPFRTYGVTKGKGLFASGVFVQPARTYELIGVGRGFYPHLNLFKFFDGVRILKGYNLNISMKFNIRKDEIMKYTNFAVERKE